MVKQRTSWNKGLTKETDERVRKYTEKKIGKARPDMIGNSWLKGKKQSPEFIKKRSEAIKKFWDKNKNSEGVLKRNRKISDKKKGKNWNYIDGKSDYRKRPTKNGRLVSHIVWCQANNIHRVPDGCVIHHIDLDTENNSPENLQLMTPDFHSKLHAYIAKRMKGGDAVVTA